MDARKQQKERAKQDRKKAARLVSLIQGGSSGEDSSQSSTASNHAGGPPRHGISQPVQNGGHAAGATGVSVRMLGDVAKISTEVISVSLLESFSALAGMSGRNSSDPIPRVFADTIAASVSRPDDGVTVVEQQLTVVPTPIQAECWARMLSPFPQDIVAISPTGSGKTLAFLVPALVEVHACTERNKGLVKAKHNASDRVDPASSQGLLLATSSSGAHEVVQGLEFAQPFVLVLAPTRELCLQTAEACARIVDNVRLQDTSWAIQTFGIVGGVDFKAQRDRLLQQQPLLVVATPGRLLSLCGETPASTRMRQKQNDETCTDGDQLIASLCLTSVSLLILDEADRLLELGFESDINSVRRLLGVTKRQSALPRLWTMMFSATWAEATQKLAANVMAEGSLHITVGCLALAAATTVQQHVELMKGKGAPRFKRLCAVLEECLPNHIQFLAEYQDGVCPDTDSENIYEREELKRCHQDPSESLPAMPMISTSPRVLVFVMFKAEAKEVATSLVMRGFAAAALQGDMSQNARSVVLQRFREGGINVLVATDVAARGLDIDGVDRVVNFSLGMSIDTYVHRIGRCGRAGRSGIAHTFVIDRDFHLTPGLVEVLERNRQSVPKDLVEVARAAQASAERLADSVNTHLPDDEEDDEDGLKEQQRANRQRQLGQRQANQTKQQKGKGCGKGGQRRK